MARWSTIARGAAFAGVASLALAACSSSGNENPSDAPTAGGGDATPLTIGTFLPVTGTLSFLGPPEIAGVRLAVQEINEAGGLFGSDVELIETDSSDTNNAGIGAASIASLISADVSAIIGAASSGVTLNVIDDVDAAGIVMVSPANTSTTLSGYSDFYFRTAPADTAQGAAVADLMLEEGAMNVAVLVQNDDYGTSFRNVVQGHIEEAGGTITYGVAGQEIDPAATNFSSDVQGALATNPDAILMIAFDQTAQIIPELIAAEYDATKIYMTDGNTADWSATFEPGTLEGGKGTIPGAAASDELQAALNELWLEQEGEELTDFSYASESYDAVMLVALAALKGGSGDSATIQANMAAVSGSNGGTECATWAECSELIEAGEEIAYQALSGAGAFDENNDPKTAIIGVYQYDENNIPSRISEVYFDVS
jgi:branched-chain amino acid transport system substrate-binding protein